MTITIQDIDTAASRLTDVAQQTPLQFSKRLSHQYGAHIYLKREDLQEVRSFKIRGAYNKISSLSDEEKKQGVVCASAGNHAQGVAYSCHALNIHGVIFMPVVTPNQKIDKVQHFGDGFVEIQLVGNTFDDANTAAIAYAKKKNCVYVHPFDDPLTIAGQGTVGKEMYEQADGKVDFVLVAIGGGGLMSGISTYIKSKLPHTHLIGVEPLGAPGMHAAFQEGTVTSLAQIDTFVDGAAVKTVGSLTYDICKQNLDTIILVPEGKVCTTMIELYQNEGIVTEPAGALTVSALDEIAGQIRSKTVVCVISGGNNDILRYPEIMERSLVYQGRKHYFIIEFAQKPGQLKKFVDYVMSPSDDIVLFEYIKKNNKEKGPALVGIELKSSTDLEPLLNRMKEIELNYTILKSDDVLYKYLI